MKNRATSYTDFYRGAPQERPGAKLGARDKPGSKTPTYGVPENKQDPTAAELKKEALKRRLKKSKGLAKDPLAERFVSKTAKAMKFKSMRSAKSRK